MPSYVVPVDATQQSLVALNTLVARTRKLLLDEPWEDYLTADLDISSPSLQVNDPASWATGDILEFRDDSVEEVKVRVGGATPMTVKRGHNDTTPAAHINGVTILKNPRFPGDEILEALTRTCDNLWPQAWSVSTVAITPVSGVTAYALPVDLRDLVRVTQDITPAGSTNLTPYFYGIKGSGAPALVARNLPGTVSSTGNALLLPNIRSYVNPIVVSYRVFMNTSIVAAGAAADVVVLGAVKRLMGVRQVVRSGQDIRQGEPGTTSTYLQDIAYYDHEFDVNLRQLYLQLLENDGPQALWRE